jgi:hypothetical protein
MLSRSSEFDIARAAIAWKDVYMPFFGTPREKTFGRSGRVRNTAYTAIWAFPFCDLPSMIRVVVALYR